MKIIATSPRSLGMRRWWAAMGTCLDWIGRAQWLRSEPRSAGGGLYAGLVGPASDRQR